VIKQLSLKPDSLLKGGIYSLLLVGLYYSSHGFMVRWWEREDYNYCYLIPFIVLYLIWERRKDLTQLTSETSWNGIVPVVIGLGLFWLGELGGEFYVMYLSSWFVLLGLCWLHLGWHKLKVLLFPLGFILTMFPPPDIVYFNLSLKLKLISSKLGVYVLQTLGITAYREGNVIDLGFTQLQVVDACNGIRYLFPLIVLSILVSYFYRSAWWKKGVVVISAIPISILVNGLRIASVGLLYPIWGKQVAEGFFHDFSGWAIFMLSLGFLLVEMHVLNIIFPENKKGEKVAAVHSPEDLAKTHQQGEDEVRDRSYRKTFLSPIFMTVLLMMGATVGIAHTVNFREAIPISKSLRHFPMSVSHWNGKPDVLEQKFIDWLDFSDYLVADYKNASGKNVNLYVAYYASQRKGESIHSPSSCLPGGGWVLKQSGKVALPVGGSSAVEVQVNRAVIQKGDSKQLIYYWFPMRGRIATRMWEIKILNFWDALIKRRTDGALIRLITPLYENEKSEVTDARLEAFIKDFIPLINTYLPQ